MSEVPEFYSDMFEIVGGPFGIVLNFRKGPAEPRAETRETVARMRMSWEHAKAMTFVIWRHIRNVESNTGVSYPLSSKVLSDMNIGREDWDRFWSPPPTF